MRLTVFGGTRGTGLELIEKAVAEDHKITALARRPEILRTRFPAVHIVPGDVYDLETVKAAVAGSDAVFSTLGFTGRARETTIYSEGVLNIARAMEELKVRRLIVLAASQGIDPHPDFSWYASILMKLIIQPMFGFAYRDMAKMTGMVSKLDLDWTLVGVPYLTSGRGTDRYRSSIGAPLHHPFRICRADVASYMLSITNDTATFRNWTEIAW